nr:DExH-box ATP-dependent RNA helicase DExH1-like isoform X2 [Physcomitrium patens]|eukprot:XP_024395088.1 DExH-box ATP-dependent RNA helicase DExH1-like isoform X2 [Physcomitrella patens]
MSATTETRVENMLANIRGAEPSSSSSPQISKGNAADKATLPRSSWGQATPQGQTLGVDKDKLNMELRENQRQLKASGPVKALEVFRKKLPAFQMKTELLEAVKNNQVVVVSGETGCGKTTQLPQFVLEEEIENCRGSECNIICTQPRRISAMSVAARVAAERGDALGQSVGYQIRLEAKRSAETRLLFCTTGVLLRRLVQEPDLNGVSHVMVDEIHERGMNEDFLLIILRDLLPRRPDLRLVLMSATINAELFSRYFGGAPMKHIPGFTYPVKELFLEDVLELTRFPVGSDQGGYNGGGGGRRRKTQEKVQDPVLEAFEGVNIESAYRNYSRGTQQSLQAWNGEQIDIGLVEAALQHICVKEEDGAILVFLTGWDEISKLVERLKGNSLFNDSRRFLILPLHGSMPTINQREIFQRPSVGVRKIVLATNIAETSITIDDVVYVIDCGKAKETSYDALNKLACLTPTWISKASAHQRRGRAGRVQPGVCYHLYPKLVYDSMLRYQLPEILRTPLQELCLQIKSLQLGNIASFLSKALEPPEVLAVQNAIDLLKTIGALSNAEDLTPLGCHLAKLPVDPKVGKMLLMGAVFQCLGPALTIAAGLAHRDPFVLPLEHKEEADEARRYFAGDSRSDHVALLKAFEGWQEAKRAGRERNFCWENFLSSNTLQMMDDMRRQFQDLLSDIGFFDKSKGTQIYNQYSQDLEMVRAVLCAGLFPSVVQCKARGKRTAFFTKEDGKVEPHPASVNSRVNSFPRPWLVYGEKVKTSAIYVRDSTNVSDYALLMFGGNLTVSKNEQSVEMLGGYLQFQASKKTLQLVRELRSQLDMLLDRKVKNPQFDIHREGKPVVTAVLELLQTNGNDDGGYGWGSGGNYSRR